MEENNIHIPKSVSGAKVIQVIQTSLCIGKGTEDDVLRFLTQYWSLDGKLLAENDHEVKNS